MKQITAIIKPFKLEEVREALAECGETGQTLDFKREVTFQRFFVMLTLGVVHDVVHHVVDLLVVQGVDVDASDIPVYADHGWQACREVQVRRFVFDAKCEQLGNVHGVLSRRMAGLLRSRDYDDDCH